MSNVKQLKDILGKARNETRGGAPRDAWVKQNRETLLMQVRNTTDSKVTPSVTQVSGHLFSIFFPKEGLILAARAAAVFVLVIGTVFSGGLASGQLYKAALPGEAMYQMKLAVESTQLLLAPNDDYRVRLHAEFADRRLEEVASLASGAADGHPRIPGVLARFNREVVALQAGLDDLRSRDAEGVIETAKLLERKMASYQNSLRDAFQIVSPEARRSIAKSSDLVDGTTISSIAVIVEEHLAGATGASRTVVVNRFEEQIRLAEEKLAVSDSLSVEVDEKSEMAKVVIAEARELIKDEQYQAALTKIAEVAELTKADEGLDEESVEEEPVEGEEDESEDEASSEEEVDPASEVPEEEVQE